jgi:hypothetical protein
MGEAASSLFSASISLLAGYAFIRLSYYRKFSASSLRTDRLALHLLGYSFVAYVVGDFLAEVIPDFTPSSPTWLANVRVDLDGAGIKAPVINSIAFAVIAAALDNLRVRILMRSDVSRISRGSFLEDLRIAAVARFVRKSNDSALRVIFRATILQKPIMLTLKSHKVYVGKPYLLPWEDPTTELTYVKILVSQSGYRDPLTKKVNLTTRYSELSDNLVELDDERSDNPKDPTDPLSSDILGLAAPNGEIVAEVDLNDMGVIIAWAQVETLTIYDENLYKAFQAQGPSAGSSDLAGLPT